MVVLAVQSGEYYVGFRCLILILVAESFFIVSGCRAGGFTVQRRAANGGFAMKVLSFHLLASLAFLQGFLLLKTIFFLGRCIVTTTTTTSTITFTTTTIIFEVRASQVVILLDTSAAYIGATSFWARHD
jgi:hypothetical protein